MYKVVYDKLLSLEEKESLTDPDVSLHLDVIFHISKYILKASMQEVLLEDFLKMPENVYKFKIINNIMKNKHFNSETQQLR